MISAVPTYRPASMTTWARTRPMVVPAQRSTASSRCLEREAMATTAMAPSSAMAPRIEASTRESVWLSTACRCAALITAHSTSRLVTRTAAKEKARDSRAMALAASELRQSAERRAISHDPPSPLSLPIRPSGADHARSSPGTSTGATSTARTASRKDASAACPPPVGSPSMLFPGRTRRATSSWPAHISAHAPARTHRTTPMRRRTGTGEAVRTASVAGVRTALRAGPIAPMTAMPTTETTVSATVAGVWATSIRPMRCAAMRVSTSAKGWSTASPTRMPGTQATAPSTATVATTLAST